MKILSIMLYFLLVSVSNASFAKKHTIPLEHFSQMPMIQEPSISPDGKNIAAIYNNDGKTQVIISQFGSSEIKPLLALGAEKYRIDQIDWANNERLIVTVSRPLKIRNNNYRSTHIYSASIDGKSVFELRRRSSRK